MSPSSPLTLLTLRLSSSSFLETILTDNNQPVYSTETNENTTILSRCDPYHGLTPVANIQWPERSSGKGKGFPPAQIFMDGRMVSEDDLLKRNCLNTSRKFRIPGHSNPLKWRRVQGVFQCVTSSGTPVAVFEPAILTARARMHIYVPTLSGLPEAHSGVVPILVDYLLVTVLLLITHPEDWHGFAASPPAVSRQSAPPLTQLQIPYGSPSLSSASAASPTSMSTSSPPSPLSPSSPSTSDASYHSRQQQRQAPTSPPASCTHTALATTPTPTPMTPLPCWEPRCDLRRLASSVDFTASNHALVKDETFDLEPPPPYEEIQWTVRVRQPRRPRTAHH